MLGWLGGRLRLERLGPLALDLSAYGGRSAEAAGGSWLNGSFGARLSRRLGRLRAGGRLEVFGLDYSEPFSYRAYGFTAEPRLTRTFGSFTVTARGELTRGRWSLSDSLDAGTAEPIDLTADGSIALTGGGVLVARSLGPAWLEASATAYDARNGQVDGTFASLGASAAFSLDRIELDLGATLWSTPLDTELGLDATLSSRLGDRVIAYATVEKTATDPLYGSPGSVTASFGVSWRLAARRLSAAAPVVELAEAVGSGRKVRFQLPAGDAERVALAGTFTDWEPRAMRRSGDRWILELVLEPGLHQFVFLLDGDRWYVPDHAPGIVDDGWGRRNASLVIVQEK